MDHHASLEDFEKVALIGKGSYAKVYLVKRKECPQTVYALKEISKKYIQIRKQQQHVMTQRNILAEVEHPFIVKLYYTFQNTKKLIFVLQYCPGGQIFELLRKQSKFSQQAAKFYAAQVVLALEYLHSKDIIYRDLKPQNILIDSQGYIRLADFGLSKKNVSKSQAISICGTLQYLAPQMLYRQGYGKPVDWWCFGCLIYEMITGFPPFYCLDRCRLFDKIKFQNPVLSDSMSKNLKSLLQLLLIKKPDKRLGSNGITQIKKHQWFSNIKWQKIYQKKIKAPYIPKLQSLYDLSNFDPEYTSSDINYLNQSPTNPNQITYSYNDFSYDKGLQNSQVQKELIQDFVMVMTDKKVKEQDTKTSQSIQK